MLQLYKRTTDLGYLKQNNIKEILGTFSSSPVYSKTIVEPHEKICLARSLGDPYANQKENPVPSSTRSNGSYHLVSSKSDVCFAPNK